jgi:O-antigen/teichoic acid export membrane protein
MTLRTNALKNVSSSWFGLASNFVVGFFLSPFILHRLGDDAFGLWVLVFSLTGYYGLFDFGIRSSIVRYVAQFKATGEKDSLNRFINTSLCTYGGTGLVLLMVTTGASFYVDSVFRIPAPLQSSAKVLFLVVGTAAAVGFPLSVFAGVLEGLQKFNWLSLTQAGYNMARAVLIVIALRRGGGLLTIALISMILNLCTYAVYFAVVQRELAVRYALRYVSRESFRKMVSFGSITFIIVVAFQLRFYSDAVVIGMFLSSSAITYFSIGSKLVSYASGVTQNMSQIFTPMSSEFNATGNVEGLRRVLVMGNRACALIAFPICTSLLIVGKSVIEVWVGAKYVPVGYVVLAWFAVGDCTEVAQSASPKILFGMARHRTMGLVRLAEGAVNLVLSIVLLRYYGVVGVAMGTVLPQLCTNLVFMPRHLCRALGMRVQVFLSQSYLAPLLLNLPLIAVLLVLQRFFRPHNYLELLACLAAGGAVYGVGVLWFLLTREQMGIDLRARFARFRQPAMEAANVAPGLGSR